MGRPKSTNPRNVTLHVRLAADEAKLFQACADHAAGKADANLSQFLRGVIREYAERHGVDVAVEEVGPLSKRGEDILVRTSAAEGSLDPDKRDESAGGYYAPGEPAPAHVKTADVFDFARVRDEVREFYADIIEEDELDELFVTAIDGAHAKVVTRSSGGANPMNIPLADLEAVPG